MFDGLDKETKAYLARIRKTIEDSQHLVEQAGLRIRETDRMLEQQGLTREQVMAMHFSDAQIEAANAELKRRGLDPLERWAMSGDEGQGEGSSFYAGRETTGSSHVSSLSSEDFAPDAELAERQRKFGMMMKPFQI